MLFSEIEVRNGRVISKDSIQEDSYTYKGIEYERKDLWEKLKEEGMTKRFFTLSAQEKLRRDGQYIIYQAPNGCLYAVTRDTNDSDESYVLGIIKNNPIENILPMTSTKGNHGIDLSVWEKAFKELGINIKKKGNVLTKDIKFNETPDSEFDKDELALGIKTEMEHTDSEEEAKSIAKDHLNEDKSYYTKLVKMEAKDKEGDYLDINKEAEKKVIQYIQEIKDYIKEGIDKKTAIEMVLNDSILSSKYKEQIRNQFR